MELVKLIKVACALMFAAGSAAAGELTLYNRIDFGGREITLREPIPDLAALGYDERTASMMVRRGRWELCSQPGFRGECAVLERGEYRNFRGGLARIASAREVGTQVQAGTVRNSGRKRGMMEIYAGAGLSGNSTRVLFDVSDFVEIGFNDRTLSMRIENGTWQLCSDANYRGSCRNFGPGNYDDLGARLNGKVSSARLVPDADVNNQPPELDPNVALTMWREEGLRGRSLSLIGDAADLGAIGFNDAAASMVIQNGTWEFCVEPNYRGVCRLFGPGQYRAIEGALMRSISSARMVSQQGRVRFDGDLELFSSPDFSGSRVGIKRDMPNLDEVDFNDRAGSIIIYSGNWRFCVDANYGGMCVDNGPGRYGRLGYMNNVITSIRRLR
jgi:hypothetical protein